MSTMILANQLAPNTVCKQMDLNTMTVLIMFLACMTYLLGIYLRNVK